MHFMNETLHPEAEDLCHLIFQQAGQDEEDRNYDAINALAGGVRVNGRTFGYRGEEALADLYARIAEKPLREVGKTRATQLVSRCLWENARVFPHG